MQHWEQVEQLLREISPPSGESAFVGASTEVLSSFAERTGLQIPTELGEWLGKVNGSRLGPGGLLGIRPDDSYVDIETALAAYPEWRDLGWIPIAGDGCGNYYVLASQGMSRPVMFVDTASDYRKPAYIAASSVWTFLCFLLQGELVEKRWPFSRDYVLSVDPEIEATRLAPLPWET